MSIPRDIDLVFSNLHIINTIEPMSQLPQRANPWQLLTAFNDSAPRWPGALRAALAIFIPGAIALAAGYEHEMFLIAAGGCAVIYGEGHPYRSRASVMITAGLLLSLGAMSGAFVGSVVWSNGAHWWLLLSALFCTAISAIGAFVQNALRLAPPGAFFIVMVSGGSTMVARLGFNPVEVGLWAMVGAASGVILGMLPALVDPHGPERRNVEAVERAVAEFVKNPHLSQRLQCQTALEKAWTSLGDAGIINLGEVVMPSQKELVARTQRAQHTLITHAHKLGLNQTDPESATDTPAMLDPERDEIPLTRPSKS